MLRWQCLWRSCCTPAGMNNYSYRQDLWLLQLERLPGTSSDCASAAIVDNIGHVNSGEVEGLVGVRQIDCSLGMPTFVRGCGLRHCHRVVECGSSADLLDESLVHRLRNLPIIVPCETRVGSIFHTEVFSWRTASLNETGKRTTPV